MSEIKEIEERGKDIQHWLVDNKIEDVEIPQKLTEGNFYVSDAVGEYIRTNFMKWHEAKVLEARIDELKSPYIAIDCIKERIVELQKQQKEKE